MPGLRDLCLKPEVLYESAKFKELRKLLPDLVRTQGRRVLLFMQWTRLLDLMVELCNDLDLGDVPAGRQHAHRGALGHGRRVQRRDLVREDLPALDARGRPR